MKPETTPSIAVYTLAGARIVKPLLDAKLNIIGIAERSDYLKDVSLIKKYLIYIYWFFIKHSRPLYNSCLAQSFNISHTTTNNPNSDEFKSWLKLLSPDILLVYQTPILSEEVFSIPKYGTINIHPSLLPKYRGPHPIFWMHYNYDLDSGCTLHYIDKGIDTGPIIGQSHFKIIPGSTEKEIEKLAIENHGIPLFIQLIKDRKYLSKNTNFNALNKNFPYARRLSTNEYFNAIDWDNWDLKHTWHVLRCNDNWKSKFDTTKGIGRFCDWSIGNYQHTHITNAPGKFVQAGRKYFITHKDGIIKIKRTFSIIILIKIIAGM